MGEARHPGARLSLVVWANLMRFVGEGGISVRDLARKALAPDNHVKFELGCLERWGFVRLQPDPSGDRSVPSGTQQQSGRELRAGWGSGRVGAGARQRMRDLVAQTEAFVRDPAGRLPHYPLWNMNRGFGP